MIQEKGTDTVPFFFAAMANETQIKSIADIMRQLLEKDPGCFLVEIRIKPINNVRIALDADGGLPIAKCIEYNRALNKILVEKAIFQDGDYSLEVSSPGLDEPLKMKRQYIKNVGRMVEVELADGSKTEGRLTLAGDTEIKVEETRGKNKKREVIEHTILFDNIKSTKIQIVF